VILAWAYRLSDKTPDKSHAKSDQAAERDA
jgi:hypothetical protein